MCNNDPIDNTNVMLIIAAVGIEFRYPLDTELLPTPTLNSDNNQELFKYLRDVSTNPQIEISTLQIRIEEGITVHSKHWNKIQQKK